MSEVNNEPRLKLADILVGDRHRQDLGDIAALAKSIRDVGLLHPIVVTPDHRLVAGRRRLEAVRELAWAEVPVNVVQGLDDALLFLRAERDENQCRKAFTPSEAVAIGKALEELERVEAKNRQEATKAKKGQKIGTTQGGGNLPPPCVTEESTGVQPVVDGEHICLDHCNQRFDRPVWLCSCRFAMEGEHIAVGERCRSCGSEQDKCNVCSFHRPTAKGKTRDKVAEAVGMSGRTYDKAKGVVEAAEEDPGKFGDLAAEMDRTGKIDPAYEKVRHSRSKDELVLSWRQRPGETAAAWRERLRAVPEKGKTGRKKIFYKIERQAVKAMASEERRKQREAEWSVYDDQAAFRRLFDKCSERWKDEDDKQAMRQYFRQLANET